MEFNFNKIKKLIEQDKNEPLPPELDWKHMEHGIFEKIESIAREESIQNKRRNTRKRFRFLLVFLFVMILGLFSVSQFSTRKQAADAGDKVLLSREDASNNSENNIGDTDQNIDKATQIGQRGSQENQIESLPNQTKSQASQFESVPNQRESQASQIKSISNQTKSQTSQVESQSSQNKSIPNQIKDANDPLEEKNGISKTNDRTLVFDASGSNQEGIQTPNTSESVQAVTDPLLLDQHLDGRDLPNGLLGSGSPETPHPMGDATYNNSTVSSASTHADVKTPISPLMPLPMLGFDQISVAPFNHSIPDIPPSDSTLLLSNNPGISPNQLILEGGLTFWNEGYGSNKPERAQYETPITSFQLQGHYMRRFKNAGFLMAGLQYQQLESRFEYNATIDNYMITLKDTIILVQNNLITGEQNIIRGDIEQLVNAERRIIHYNQTKMLKVSLGVGKSWRFNSLQADVYLGGALNSLVHHQGRSLHNDIVIDYNGSSNSFIQNQWALDGITGLRLHYFAGKNIGLTAGLQAQKSLTNWSTQDDVRFYPFSFSLQIGLSYSF